MAAGKEIKRLRGNVSAAKAASLMGVDPDRLRKWEERNVDPKDVGDINAVENYFGCTLKELESLDKFQFGPKEKVPVKEPESEDFLKRAILNLTEDKLESTAVIKRLTGLLELQAKVYLSQLSKSNQVVTNPESETSAFQDLTANVGKQKKADKRPDRNLNTGN